MIEEIAIEESKDTLCMMCAKKTECLTAIFFDFEKMYCDEFSKEENIEYNL